MRTLTKSFTLAMLLTLALPACGDFDPEGAEASEAEGQISAKQYGLTASQRALVVLLENGGVGLPGAYENLSIPVWTCRSFHVPEMESATPWFIITSIVSAGVDALSCLSPQNWVRRQMNVNTWLQTVSDAGIERIARQQIINAGVLSAYGRVIFLEGADFTAARLKSTLQSLTPSYVIDLHILTHGSTSEFGVANRITDADVLSLKQITGLRLRSVYQMNCYGSYLSSEWSSAGARTVNGAVGINYMPLGYFSFLTNWLKGVQFGGAVVAGVISSMPSMQHLYQHVDLFDWNDSPWSTPKVSLGHNQSPNEEMNSSQMQLTGTTGLTINSSI